MWIGFCPRRRLRQALAVGGLATAAFFCWFLGASVDRQVSGAVPQVIYRGDSGLRAVGLMFNVDWGEEYVPQILGLLAQHDARATFLVTGQWAEKYPALVQAMAEAGHEVGNHGYSHLHVGTLDKRAIKGDIEKASAALEPLGGSIRFYAPPYGEISTAVVEAASETGCRTVLWTIDTIDWQPNRTVPEIMAKVQNNLVNGALVLLHPTAVTVQSLPGLLEHLNKEGYQMLPLTEIVAP